MTKTPIEIFFNGRFLTQPLTGVQRFAYEVIGALDGMIDRGEIDCAAYRLTCLMPPHSSDSHSWKWISVQAVGGLMGIGMVGSVILTRALGVEARGIVSWIASLALIAMGILQFGLGPASRLFVAEDPLRAGDMAVANIMLILLGSLIILPFFIIYGISEEIGSNNLAVLIIGLACAPIMAIAGNLGELLLGLHLEKSFNIFLLTQRIANTLLSIVLVIFGIANPLLVVIVLLVSNIVQMAVAIFALQPQIKTRLRRVKETLLHIRFYLVANYVSNILLLFSTSIIPIILVNKHSLKDAGLFAACMVLIDAARSSIRMVGMHTLPMLAKAKALKQRRKIIKHSIVITLLFSVVAALIFYITSGWLLALLFGAGFSEGKIIMQILSFGLVAALLFNALHSIICAVSKGLYIVIPSLALAIATVIAAIILVPLYGAVGGAIAFIAGFIASSLISGLLILSIMARERQSGI